MDTQDETKRSLRKIGRILITLECKRQKVANMLQTWRERERIQKDGLVNNNDF